MVYPHTNNENYENIKAINQINIYVLGYSFTKRLSMPNRSSPQREKGKGTAAAAAAAEEGMQQ